MTSMREDQVLVAMKTPLMARAITTFLPGSLTLAQSLQEFRKIPPKDATARRVLQQLERETSGAFAFLVVTRTGEVAEAQPSTALQEIAVLREIRTPRGLDKIPTAAVEVQSYAPVGGQQPC